MFVKIHVVGLWVMTFCSLVGECQYFGATCFLHAQPDVLVYCVALCHNAGHHTIDSTKLPAQIFYWI
jgi:hypothetical protein